LWCERSKGYADFWYPSDAINAQRSTPNVSMEPLRFEVLSVEKEPRRFLTPQHKFIERPEEALASGGLRAGLQDA